MLLTVFEVFYWGPRAGVDSGPLPVPFVGFLLLARVDDYERLSSVWGCFVEHKTQVWVCVYGFCNVWVCVCGFCNVWVRVCVGLVMCRCVYV